MFDLNKFTNTHLGLCPKGFDYNGRLQTCFFYIERFLTWSTIHSSCQSVHPDSHPLTFDNKIMGYVSEYISLKTSEWV